MLPGCGPASQPSPPPLPPPPPPSFTWRLSKLLSPPPPPPLPLTPALGPLLSVVSLPLPSTAAAVSREIQPGDRGRTPPRGLSRAASGQGGVPWPTVVSRGSCWQKIIKCFFVVEVGGNRVYLSFVGSGGNRRGEGGSRTPVLHALVVVHLCLHVVVRAGRGGEIVIKRIATTLEVRCVMNRPSLFQENRHFKHRKTTRLTSKGRVLKVFAVDAARHETLEVGIENDTILRLRARTARIFERQGCGNPGGGLGDTPKAACYVRTCRDWAVTMQRLLHTNPY